MTTQTNKPNEANAPKYHAYYVVEGDGRSQKARWNRIGAAFAHANGEGLTLMLDSLPIHFDGRIVMRTPKAE